MTSEAAIKKYLDKNEDKELIAMIRRVVKAERPARLRRKKRKSKSCT